MSQRAVCLNWRHIFACVPEICLKLLPQLKWGGEGGRELKTLTDLKNVTVKLLDRKCWHTDIKRPQKTTECLGQRKCKKAVLLVPLVPFSRLALSFLLLLPLCSFTQVNNTLKKYICGKLSACLTQAHSKNCLFLMGLLILNLVDCFRGIQNQVGTEFTLGPDRTFSWLHFNLISVSKRRLESTGSHHRAQRLYSTPDGILGNTKHTENTTKKETARCTKGSFASCYQKENAKGCKFKTSSARFYYVQQNDSAFV